MRVGLSHPAPHSVLWWVRSSGSVALVLQRRWSLPEAAAEGDLPLALGLVFTTAGEEQLILASSSRPITHSKTVNE